MVRKEVEKEAIVDKWDKSSRAQRQVGAEEAGVDRFRRL
jgi:hypothetical protein